MKIQTFQVHPYSIPLTNKQVRTGILLRITNDQGNTEWGEVAPLPNWSRETLDDCLEELRRMQPKVMAIDWTSQSLLQEFTQLKLLPALSFGLESALFALLDPLPEHYVPTSALLMGTIKEILARAEQRYDEGYTSAKLKVNHLSFEEAAHVIHQLKEIFRLRIDVNRAWSTSESLSFFSQFPLNTFDYVEEPFQNPHDLAQFPHPLAIDESFPQDLTLEELETFPTLKALIYKPTIQGGMLHCTALHDWATKRGLSLVLSSSFESDLGLAHVASIAHRLSITAPTGIGTYHYLSNHISNMRFSDSIACIPSKIWVNHL